MAAATDTPSTGPFSESPDFAALGIRNVNINKNEDVSLTAHQKLLIGSVLDLFEGNPTLKHLSLWSPDATFKDPLSIATGFYKYAAQWYGLPALFHPINIVSHVVSSGGNPIELKLSNKYVVRVIKKEQVIDSVVRIYVGDDGKIQSVEDRWNDKLPEGAVAQAFRKLNAITVPAFVRVPKNEEEDLQMQAERDGRTSQG